MTGADPVDATVAAVQDRPGMGAAAQRRLLRTLTIITSVSSVTFGLMTTMTLVYFVRQQGIPVVVAGATVTVASLLGIAWGVPAGFLTDALGARAVLTTGILAWSLGTLLFATVSTVAGYAAVTCLVTAAYQTTRTARDALVGAIEPRTRVEGRARIHVVANIGLALGSVIGGAALTVDEARVYRWLFAAGAVVLAAGALSAARMSAPAAVRTSGSGFRPGTAVLRDSRYLTVAAGNAVLSVHFGIYEAALPLWVVLDTEAPHWLVGALMVINTVVVVLLQVPAARRAPDVPGAARVLRWSGGLFLGSFLLLALAHDRSVLLASAALVAGIVVYSIGEVLQTAGSWTLSYDLAREDLHGQYQGVFNTAASTGIACGPVVTSGILLRFGMAGWLLAGLALTATAIVTPMAASRDRRPHRDAAPRW